MTGYLLVQISAITVSVILGCIVFLTNSRRTTNQVFLFLSAILTAWLACVAVGFVAHDAGTVKLCIKGASIAGIMVPLALNWLRISILCRADGFKAVVSKSPVWLLMTALVILACFSDFYVHGITFPLASQYNPHPIPEPIYGPFIYLYGTVYLVQLFSLVSLFIRDLRKAEGIHRTELQFILLGGSLGLLFGIMAATIAPLILGSSQSTRFAFGGVVILDGVVAYGIATKRMLDVAYFLRRILAYGLLAGYLVIIYLVAWIVFNTVWRFFVAGSDLLPHLLAALAIAFSVAPAHGLMQRFADRLSLAQGPADIGRTLQKANDLLQAVTTLDDLLQRFALIVSEAMGADRVVVLMEQKGRFVQTPMLSSHTAPLAFDPHSSLIQELAIQIEPLVADVIHRSRVAEQLDKAAEEMHQAGIAVAVGIKSKGVLEAVLLLGPRLSGRIYSAIEQDALQLLCNQLAVALENARLYTQVQNDKIYNDILLDNLVNGVIAVNAEGCITVFNREAQRVTGLQHDELLNQPFTRLPAPMEQTLRTILEQGQRLVNREIQLARRSEEIVLRCGGAVFKSQAGKTLGALLVFSDMTDIKKLEQQVRRSDRLASVGTLSAGMAHEIKNPLVALKTFTQLLPERYDDQDFRETFSRLVHHEVERIDSIVNQLLEFSRPAKPNLTQVPLHTVVQHSLKLMSEEALKKKVALSRHLEAPVDTIMGDKHQLQQILLNLLLNALDSMAQGGRLTVSTAVVQGQYSPTPDAVPGDYIRLDIADTGSGIAPEALPHIFDPFFTTKSNGTGLGLTVAHGIILEHSGMVDVESRVGQGTIFHIFFPLLKEPAIDKPVTT